MSNQYGPRIINDNLTMCFDAGNSKSYSGSGSTVYDISGNSYTGTLSNITYSSINGGFFTFNGTSSYISTGLTSFSSLPFTIEFWINSDSTTPVGLYDSGPSTANTMRNYPAGNFEWWNGSPYVSFSVTASTWTHLLITYRFNTTRYIDYYKNGVLISSTTGAGWTNPAFSVTGLRLGDINSGGAGRYSGKLAIARVYTKSFSTTEALQNYNAIKGRFGL